jgi:RimJ/RimL family protein N-acetyltransferase
MQDEKIYLQPIELSILHDYYKGFEIDSDIYMDMSLFHKYTYSPEKVDAYYNKLKSQKDRVDFLIMLNKKPIGEICLKHIDNHANSCEMSIHMQNDTVKNKGFGTIAEQFILKYAFNNLKMKEVLANSVIKNIRSQHTLGKVGFKEISRNDTFVYYKLSQSDWFANYSGHLI